MTEVMSEDAVAAGVVVRRDMEVTEVMSEDAVGCGCCGEERHGGDSQVMSEDAVRRVLW